MVAFARLLHVVLVLLALSTTASAADGTRWACWYAQSNESIRCLLEQAPESSDPERVADVEAHTDHRLSVLVHTIRGTPEKLAGRHISIPMWSPPIDMGFARLLAESVMCGAQKACDVAFDANSDGGAALRATARVAGREESEIVAAFEAQGLLGDLIESPAPLEVVAKTTTRRRRVSAS